MTFTVLAEIESPDNARERRINDLHAELKDATCMSSRRYLAGLMVAEINARSLDQVLKNARR